jgi:hypothetical protein
MITPSVAVSSVARAVTCSRLSARRVYEMERKLPFSLSRSLIRSV